MHFTLLSESPKGSFVSKNIDYIYITNRVSQERDSQNHEAQQPPPVPRQFWGFGRRSMQSRKDCRQIPYFVILPVRVKRLICSLGPPIRGPLRGAVRLMEVMLLVFYIRNAWDL